MRGNKRPKNACSHHGNSIFLKLRPFTVRRYFYGKTYIIYLFLPDGEIATVFLELNVTQSRINVHKSNRPRIRGLPATCEFGWANENVSVDVVKLIFILAGIQHGSCASFSADNAPRGMIISFRKLRTPAPERLFPLSLFSSLFNRGLEGGIYARESKLIFAHRKSEIS